MSEVILGALLCSFLGGSDAEVPASFNNLDTRRSIRIDCLTDDYAFEFGLDKRSSRDSIHQAVFAAEMTNTDPFVIIIDRDGVEGRFEQELRIVADVLDIRYARCSEDFITRWAATSGFRLAGLDKSLDDLPKPAAAVQQNCPILSLMDDTQ